MADQGALIIIRALVRNLEEAWTCDYTWDEERLLALKELSTRIGRDDLVRIIDTGYRYRDRYFPGWELPGFYGPLNDEELEEIDEDLIETYFEVFRLPEYTLGFHRKEDMLLAKERLKLNAKIDQQEALIKEQHQTIEALLSKVKALEAQLSNVEGGQSEDIGH